MFGSNCTEDIECGAEIFACINEICSCSVVYGYRGENCRVASNSTLLFFVFSGLALAATCFCVYISVRIVYTYTFKPLFDKLRSNRVVCVVNQNEHEYAPKSSTKRRMKRHKSRLRLHCKDTAAIYNIFFGIATSFLLIMRLLTLSSPTLAEFDMYYAAECVFASLAFFFQTCAQSSLGLAWFEVYYGCAVVASLSKLRSVRKFVRAFLILNSITIFLSLLFSSLSSTLFLWGIMSFLLPLLCIPSGWILSDKMLKIDFESRRTRRQYDMALFKTAMGIRRTVKIMLLCFILSLFSSSFAFLSIQIQSSWGFGFSFILAQFSFIGYQFSIQRYADHAGLIFGCLSNSDSFLPSQSGHSYVRRLQGLSQLRSSRLT